MAHLEPALRRAEPRHPDAATVPGCDAWTLSAAGVRVPTWMPVLVMPASSALDRPSRIIPR